MKNKKGFTLVEILGVITIIAVLALIAIPTVDNIVTKNREKLYDSQIQTIKDGLKTWGNANAISLPEDGEDALLLSLGILKLAGFVDADIKDPNTNLCFSNDMQLSITAVKEGYRYSVDEESGLAGTEEDCSAPTTKEFIYLRGSSNIDLILGDTYTEPGFVALNANGNVAAGSVTTVIKDKDGTVVSSIDTTESTASPYTITYTYGEVAVTRVVNVSIVTEYSFNYTGSPQNVTLNAGTYKLESWGAQGGDGVGATYGAALGGKGGYSKGEITLSTSTQLYIIVGGAGSSGTAGPNHGLGGAGGFGAGGSGGTAWMSQNAEGGAGGGGLSGIFSSTTYNNSMIIIAGGGGGAGGSSSNTGDYHNGGSNGGAGGGTTGENGAVTPNVGTITTKYFGYGGSQTAGGATNTYFENTYAGTPGGLLYGGGGHGYNPGVIGNNISLQGGSAITTTNTASSAGGSGGGGGGYYGGGGGGKFGAGAGGGSSYITGLTNATSILGNALMPTHDGTGTMTGNSGNGYVKITKIA